MENDCGTINSRFWLILLVFYMVRPNVFGACRIMVLSKSTAVAHFGVRGNAGRPEVVLYLVGLQTLF